MVNLFLVKIEKKFSYYKRIKYYSSVLSLQGLSLARPGIQNPNNKKYFVFLVCIVISSWIIQSLRSQQSDLCSAQSMSWHSIPQSGAIICIGVKLWFKVRTRIVTSAKVHSSFQRLTCNSCTSGTLFHVCWW